MGVTDDLVCLKKVQSRADTGGSPAKAMSSDDVIVMVT